MRCIDPPVAAPRVIPHRDEHSSLGAPPRAGSCDAGCCRRHSGLAEVASLVKYLKRYMGRNNGAKRYMRPCRIASLEYHNARNQHTRALHRAHVTQNSVPILDPLLFFSSFWCSYLPRLPDPRSPDSRSSPYSTPLPLDSRFSPYSTPLLPDPRFSPYSTPLPLDSRFSPYSTPLLPDPRFSPYSTPLPLDSRFSPYSTPLLPDPRFSPYSTPLPLDSRFSPYSTPLLPDSRFFSLLDPSTSRFSILSLLDPSTSRSPILSLLDPSTSRSPILSLLLPITSSGSRSAWPGRTCHQRLDAARRRECHIGSGVCDLAVRLDRTGMSATSL